MSMIIVTSNLGTDASKRIITGVGVTRQWGLIWNSPEKIVKASPKQNK